MGPPLPLLPVSKGPRVRWFVAVGVFLLFGVFAVILGYAWINKSDTAARDALLAGWSVLVAGVVYITHPGNGVDKAGNGT